MKSIDNFFEGIRNSSSRIVEYLQAKATIKRYEKNKPPYESLDYRNGVIPHEVVLAYDFIESLRS